MATNYTWIYGLDNEYKLVRWHRIPVISIDYLKFECSTMRDECPSVSEVYVIDASPSLSRAFRNRAINSNCIDANVVFRVILQRDGVCLWKEH